MSRCSDCGAELPPDEPGVERLPCPACGSTRRTHEGSASLTLGMSVSSKATVDRAVNEARMATFAVIFGTAIGVGTTVGFATCWWLGVLAGLTAAVATALLLALIYRVDPVRRVVMELMHRITRQ